MSESHKTWENLFKDLPLDEAPKENHRVKLRDQVLAEFDSQHASRIPSTRFNQLGKVLMRYNVPYWTAAALTLCLIWIALPNSKKASAQDVVAHILKARTAQWDMILKRDNNQDEVIKCYFSSGKTRIEFDSWVAIADHTQGQSVGLFINDKIAILNSVAKRTSDILEQDHFEQMRKALRIAIADPNNNVEKLGERVSDARELIGFRFKSKSFPTTIWADAETAFPVWIEVDISPESRMVMKNHKFDINLDPSLFSLEIPTGYRVLDEDSPISGGDEQDFIHALKMFAISSNDMFPDRLDEKSLAEASARYLTFIIKRDTSTQNPSLKKEYYVTDFQLVVEGGTFATALASDEKWDAHYCGAGVKLGTPDRPIFWYKPGKSQTYRVIYADLTVGDAATAPRGLGLDASSTKLASPKK